ncbi:MAG TPA: DUF2199 domain-containing protein [Alphaproteobacteria bacterium]|nr:DUF2199 domain-containing protein [Alphaproteobacteria bacterium]
MVDGIDFAWACRCCGRQYRTLPLDFAFDAPIYWGQLSEDERKNAFLNSDICKIGEDRFIRGCIDIPVLGREERFVWGAWTSLSKASLQRAYELWDAREIAPDEPARFGWLSNEMKIVYGVSTLNLKTKVRFRPDNLRPLIQVEPSDHPLAREQAEGITLDRVQEVVATLLHRH